MLGLVGDQPDLGGHVVVVQVDEGKVRHDVVVVHHALRGGGRKRERERERERESASESE